MGTKRELAVTIAATIGTTKSGTLFDAFAGMGAVAEAVGVDRPIWTNDVQHFAHLASTTMFTSRNPPPTAHAFATIVENKYESIKSTLTEYFSDSLNEESKALRADSYISYLEYLGNSQTKYDLFKSDTKTVGCFSKTYAFTYFSLHQCIEIDAARSAIECLLSEAKIDSEIWQWALLALGKASLKCANTPGHFAQYLRLHERTFRRSQRQKRRSVWSEWLIAISEMMPLGDEHWRKSNKSTRSDSLLLLTDDKKRPDISVVYCDPPYTDDQYSRFYHVLETLVLYDYPETTGAGQYRKDRFQTPFSLKTKVISAFVTLLDAIVEIGADLVLSYPSNGLLYECDVTPDELICDRFKSLDLVTQVPHLHSTFGASKGSSKARVTEQIFLARP